MEECLRRIHQLVVDAKKAAGLPADLQLTSLVKTPFLSPPSHGPPKFEHAQIQYPISFAEEPIPVLFA